MIEILATLLIINVIHGIGTWKLYLKAGYNGWFALVPIYNIYILLKIINRPVWWFFLIFVPVINTILIPVLWVEISRSFKKNSYSDTLLDRKSVV